MVPILIGEILQNLTTFNSGHFVECWVKLGPEPLHLDVHVVVLRSTMHALLLLSSLFSAYKDGQDIH